MGSVVQHVVGLIVPTLVREVEDEVELLFTLERYEADVAELFFVEDFDPEVLITTSRVPLLAMTDKYNSVSSKLSRNISG